jgi:metal-dependent amidase/aminoacylase/carboxypeptidase family protein
MSSPSTIYTDPADYESRIASHCNATIQPHTLLTKTLQDELIAIRRYLHSIAELSFKEYNTSKYIAAHLREYGCDSVIEGVAGTGVIALIYGTGTKKKSHSNSSDSSSTSGTMRCIAIRADMDALPIEEQVNERTKDFRSQTKAMHGK